MQEHEYKLKWSQIKNEQLKALKGHYLFRKI